MTPVLHSSTPPIASLPNWVLKLATILLIIGYANPLAGQEPRRHLAAGEVCLAVALRGEASELRFVPVGHLVEAGERHTVRVEPPSQMVEYFEAAAEQQIADINRACELDKRQRSKLMLAALGDMSRLARESREVQEKYREFRYSNQRELLALGQEIDRLNASLNKGVLRDGSMFLMVLKSLLTPQQSSRLAQAKFFELTRSWPIELSDGERKQLLQLVMQKVDRAAILSALWVTNDYRTLVAQLPRAELSGFLNASQIDALYRWCPQ